MAYIIESKGVRIMPENDKLVTVDDSFGFTEEEWVYEHETFDPDDPYNRKLWSYQDIDNFYQRVANCMGMGSVDQTMVDYPENAPTAERRVKAIIKDWLTISEDKFALFESCVIFMTCYIMCPILRMSAGRVQQQTTPSLSLKYFEGAEVVPCDHYLELMNDLASEIKEEEVESFFGFRVTKSSDCHKHRVWL